MEEKLKELNDMYKHLMECIVSDAEVGDCRGEALLRQAISTEMELMNTLYGHVGVLRSDVVLALMEARIDVLKGAGLYNADRIANFKKVIGSAYVRSGN